MDLKFLEIFQSARLGRQPAVNYSAGFPKRPYYYFWAGTIFELIKIVVFEATN